jgi:hypothetical protein
MTSRILITLEDALFEKSEVYISLGNGGTFHTLPHDGFTLTGNIRFGTLSVTASDVLFEGLTPQVPVHATVRMPIARADGEPTIMITNVRGTIFLEWMSDQGPQMQQFLPNHPMILAGLTD